MAGIDFSRLDLRGAFDLAILIEEEAQLRYQHFTRLVDGGALDVFKMMVRNEAKHREELVSKRDVLFRNEPKRIETSLLDDADAEAPDPDGVGEHISAREALEIALKAEIRAFEFYSKAIPHVKNPEVRKFFEELRDEEVEHQRMLRDKIAQLG
ncbi:MAG TPA: ferritin family protein [Anaeromyxobacteraceae bacterium]|nr:ferritin family protein [Anaeromyxobacteraceae bacterium]